MSRKRLLGINALSAYILFAPAPSSAADQTLTVTNKMAYHCNATGPADKCIVNCDGSNLGGAVIDCGNAGECEVNCLVNKQCLASGTLYANNSRSLVFNTSVQECAKQATIHLPHSGNATLLDAPGWKTYREAKIYAGPTTQNIYIMCDGADGDDCKNIEVRAETAQYLGIATSTTNSDLNSDGNGGIYCPQNSSYQGPEPAPCKIDATRGGIIQGITINAGSGCYIDATGASGTIKSTTINAGAGTTIDVTNATMTIDSVTINTVNGVPSDFWIKGAHGQDPFNGGDSTITCSALSAISDVIDKDTATLPLNTSYIQNCWTPTTNAPTNSPTKNPTTTPSTSPSASPSGSPSTPPTSTPSDGPTGTPSSSPTIEPTGNPSGSPTIEPTTETPTEFVWTTTDTLFTSTFGTDLTTARTDSDIDSTISTELVSIPTSTETDSDSDEFLDISGAATAINYMDGLTRVLIIFGCALFVACLGVFVFVKTKKRKDRIINDLIHEGLKAHYKETMSDNDMSYHASQASRQTTPAVEMTSEQHSVQRSRVHLHPQAVHAMMASGSQRSIISHSGVSGDPSVLNMNNESSRRLSMQTVEIHPDPDADTVVSNSPRDEHVQDDGQVERQTRNGRTASEEEMYAVPSEIGSAYQYHD